jgi:hypothetical protein
VNLLYTLYLLKRKKKKSSHYTNHIYIYFFFQVTDIVQNFPKESNSPTGSVDVSTKENLDGIENENGTEFHVRVNS